MLVVLHKAQRGVSPVVKSTHGSTPRHACRSRGCPACPLDNRATHWWDGPVKINRIVPDLTVSDLATAVGEHAEVLGLKVLMDHGWIVTLGDGAGPQLSLMTRDATAPVNPDVSVFVDDVESAYDAAVCAGLEIVHPLTTEQWGVRRFFYRDSSGRVVNVGDHA